MTVTMFLSLLLGFSMATTLIVEALKKLVGKKIEFSYNIVAFTTALIVGCGGTAIYYQLSGIAFDANNIIYLCLMGFSSAITSMVGFDKIKQTIEQLVSKK